MRLCPHVDTQMVTVRIEHIDAYTGRRIGQYILIGSNGFFYNVHHLLVIDKKRDLEIHIQSSLSFLAYIDDKDKQQQTKKKKHIPVVIRHQDCVEDLDRL